MRLISFSVSNYRSFFGEQTIRFDQDTKGVDAIYGPNGSGKSNLFTAIRFFRDFVRTSSTYESQQLQYFAFLMNDKASELPTSFRAEMQTEKWVYRYSFSLVKSEVLDETLSRKGLALGDTYETMFSRRSLQKKRYEKYGFDSALLKNTRKNTLVLTKAWENNNKYALEVFEWLDHLKMISGGQPLGLTARRIFEDTNFKMRLLELLREADLHIQDVTSTRVNLPDSFFSGLPLNDDLKKGIGRTGFNVTTTHMLRNEKGEIVGTSQLPFGLESDGTRRIFELASPLIEALENGNILYIDELETHLHPRECDFIVSLFTRAPMFSAQLIINTHSTHLMDRLGRNNVHLFGKNNREETIIGSIPKDVRTDDPALERKYNKGMFGAVPNVNA